MLAEIEPGQSVEEVIAALRKMRENDASYDGRMFGMDFYASDDGQRAAEEAYLMFMWENRLDPTVFPSVVELEAEVVSMAARHLGGDAQTAGSFTSGGTESVLLAVKTARDKARAERGVKNANMVIPITGHPCFHKGLRPRTLKLGCLWPPNPLCFPGGLHPSDPPSRHCPS